MVALVTVRETWRLCENEPEVAETVRVAPVAGAEALVFTHSRRRLMFGWRIGINSRADNAQFKVVR